MYPSAASPFPKDLAAIDAALSAASLSGANMAVVKDLHAKGQKPHKRGDHAELVSSAYDLVLPKLSNIFSCIGEPTRIWTAAMVGSRDPSERQHDHHCWWRYKQQQRADDTGFGSVTQ